MREQLARLLVEYVAHDPTLLSGDTESPVDVESGIPDDAQILADLMRPKTTSDNFQEIMEPEPASPPAVIPSDDIPTAVASHMDDMEALF